MHLEGRPSILTYNDGGNEKKFLLKASEIVIGRNPDCDLVLSDQSVSGQHARISRVGSRYVIEDLGSSQGTILNDEAVLPGKRRKILRENDQLKLGRVVIGFNAVPKLGDDPPSINTTELQSLQVARGDLAQVLNSFKQGLGVALSSLQGFESHAANISHILDQHLPQIEDFIQARIREHHVLHEVMRIIGTITDIRELLSTSLRLVAQVVGADRGFILLYDQADRQLRSMSTYHFEFSGPLARSHDIAFSRTIANTCFLKAEIELIEDALQNERFRSANSIIASSIRSVAAVPMFNPNGLPCGVIYLDHLKQPGLFCPEQKEFFKTFGLQVVIALQNAKRYNQTIHDPVTGLFTRRYLDLRLQEELDRSHRFSRPCCAVLLDVDRFDQVCDRHGSHVGDRVMRNLATLIGQFGKPVDVAARWGAGEIFVLLVETSQGQASQFAERLRVGIERLTTSGEQKPVKVTASFAVADYRPAYGTDPKQLVEAMDGAMVQAKRLGGNRVVPV